MNLKAILRAIGGVAFVLLPVFAQQAPKPKPAVPPAVDKAAAYYHFAMGHLHGELAGQYGARSAHVSQAIDHYRQAMKADPGATFIAEELADLYIQSNRLREGVNDAEAALRDNPDDLNSRRILGRIYTRLIGDTERGRVNEEMLRRAIEQFSKITEKMPSDVNSWLVLGRLHRVAQQSPEAQKAFSKALEVEPDNEEALTGLALVYSGLGDNKKAAELLKLVADKSPNLRTLMSLASSYEQMRDYALASETLRRALSMSPDNSDIKRALAQNLMLAEKYEDSITLFKELVAEEPKDVLSHLRLSQIYRQLNRYEEARQASDEAKKLEPTSLEVLYNEVGLLESDGKTSEAIAAMKAMLDSTSKRNYTDAEKNNRALLLERLGLLYRNNEQFKEAVEMFQQLGALDSALGARSAAQIVDTHRQAKAFAKAVEEADIALKKSPADRMIRMVRASALAELGRIDEAVADIRKLLDGNSDRETWLTVAQLYEKAKNYSEMAKAVDAAEKLSVTDEDKEGIYFMRGAMYEKMKRIEDSEKEFRKVLALNPDSASALNYLGYMLADRNVRLQEALDMIKKAVDMEPHNGAYLDSLGWVYFRLDRLEEAEDYLRRALNRAGKDPTIHDHLGDVYMKKGNLKDAISQWESAVALWGASSPSEHDPNEVAKIRKKLESARVRLAKEQAAGQRQP
ncbi:MAG: tetratricopeptide repeat protein [Acidimicrobiia bacterium]|nr:tetratricopeptide repeat protein [Acidimicrobiia bacterium]